MSSRTAPRILIIEEDADIRTVIGEVLEGEAIEAICVSDGHEGMSSLRSPRPPSLVLLGMLRKGLTTQEFMTEKKADPAIGSVPVVLISASPSIAAMAESLGTNGYLPKPMKIDDLLALIQRYAD